MMTTDQQVRLWCDDITRAFGFLESFGYQQTAVKAKVTSGSITYLGANLGIRFEVVTDDFFMFIALFRPEQPDYDHSEYIRECFKRLGLPLEPLNQVLGCRGDFASVHKMVDIYARSLRSSLEILEASVDVLFPR